MATEADHAPEPSPVTMIREEEIIYPASGHIDSIADETSAAELMKLQAALSVPPETVECLGETKNTQASNDVGAEAMKTIIEVKGEIPEGERFSESSSAVQVSTEDTCRIPKAAEPEKVTLQAGNELLEDGEQTQNNTTIEVAGEKETKEFKIADDSAEKPDKNNTDHQAEESNLMIGEGSSKEERIADRADLVEDQHFLVKEKITENELSDIHRYEKDRNIILESNEQVFNVLDSASDQNKEDLNHIPDSTVVSLNRTVETVMEPCKEDESSSEAKISGEEMIETNSTERDKKEAEKSTKITDEVTEATEPSERVADENEKSHEGAEDRFISTTDKQSNEEASLEITESGNDLLSKPSVTEVSIISCEEEPNDVNMKSMDPFEDEMNHGNGKDSPAMQMEVEDIIEEVKEQMESEKTAADDSSNETGEDYQIGDQKGDGSLIKDEDASATNEVLPAKATSVDGNTYDVKSTVTATTSNNSDGEIMDALEHSQSGSTKHDDRLGISQQYEPQKQKLDGCLNIVPEEFNEAAEAIAGAEETEIKSHDESHEKANADANIADSKQNEKIESAEVEAQYINADDLYDIQVKQAGESKGKILNEVFNSETEGTIQEAQEVYSEEKHIQDETESYQSSISTTFEHTSTEEAESTELTSEASEADANKIQEASGLNFKEKSVTIDKVENTNEQKDKKGEACDAMTQCQLANSVDTEASVEVANVVFLSNENAEQNILVESPLEVAPKLTGEDDSCLADETRNDITYEEVDGGTNITGTVVASDEQIIEEKNKKPKIESSESNKNITEMTEGENSGEHVTEDNRIRCLVPESDEQGTVEKLEEDSTGEIPERSDTAEANESTGDKTIKSIENPKEMPDGSSVKGNVLQTEMEDGDSKELCEETKSDEISDTGDNIAQHSEQDSSASLIEEGKVVRNSKEGESTIIKSNNQVDESKPLIEEAEAARSTEETYSETLNERRGSTVNSHSLDITKVSQAETMGKETDGSLIEESVKLMSKSKSETEELKEKEETANEDLGSAPIAVVTEEKSIQEAEPEDKNQVERFAPANEEKGMKEIETKETIIESVDIKMKPDETSDLAEKTDNEIPIATDETGETNGSLVQESAIESHALNEKTEDIPETEDATRETKELEVQIDAAHVVRKDELNEYSAMASKQHEIPTTEVSEAVYETPAQREVPTEDTEAACVAQSIHETLMDKQNNTTYPVNCPELESENTGNRTANEEVQKTTIEDLHANSEMNNIKNLSILGDVEIRQGDETRKLAGQGDICASTTLKVVESSNVELRLENKDYEKPFDNAPRTSEASTKCTESEKAIKELEILKGNLKEVVEVDRGEIERKGEAPREEFEVADNQSSEKSPEPDNIQITGNSSKDLIEQIDMEAKEKEEPLSEVARHKEKSAIESTQNEKEQCGVEQPDSTEDIKETIIKEEHMQDSTPASAEYDKAAKSTNPETSDDSTSEEEPLYAIETEEQKVQDLSSEPSAKESKGENWKNIEDPQDSYNNIHDASLTAEASNYAQDESGVVAIENRDGGEPDETKIASEESEGQNAEEAEAGKRQSVESPDHDPNINDDHAVRELPGPDEVDGNKVVENEVIAIKEVSNAAYESNAQGVEEAEVGKHQTLEGSVDLPANNDDHAKREYAVDETEIVSNSVDEKKDQDATYEFHNQDTAESADNTQIAETLEQVPAANYEPVQYRDAEEVDENEIASVLASKSNDQSNEEIDVTRKNTTMEKPDAEISEEACKAASEYRLQVNIPVSKKEIAAPLDPSEENTNVQLPRPSSVVVPKQETSVTVEKVEEEKSRKVEKLEDEGLEDSSDKTTETESSRELEVSTRGFKLDKYFQDSPMEAYKEEDHTPDGALQLEPRAIENEIKGADSSLESMLLPHEAVIDSQEKITASENTEIEEKHPAKVISEMRTETNKCMKKIEANEIIETKVLKEKIKEEDELSEICQPASLCQKGMNKSHQHDGQNAEGGGGKPNDAVKTTENEVQYEAVSLETEKVVASLIFERQNAAEDITVENLQPVSVENIIAKRSCPNEFEGKEVGDSANKSDDNTWGEERYFGCATTPEDEESNVTGSQKEIIGSFAPDRKIIHEIHELEKSSGASSGKQIPNEGDLIEHLCTTVQTGNKYAPIQEQQEIAENPQKVEVGDLKPGNAKSVASEEKHNFQGEQATEESAKGSLSDHLQRFRNETMKVAKGFGEGREPTANTEEKPSKEPEAIHVKEEKVDEEQEGYGHKMTDLSDDAPIMIEASRDMDVKVEHKKSHNILSAVGSKVKHSISKVKKAITGKSSHPKPVSPKQEISSS